MATVITSNPSSTTRREVIHRTGSDLLSVRVWDVEAPAPLNSFRGAVVPKFLLRGKKHRKISIEVHRVHVPVESVVSPTNDNRPTSYEECIVRVLEPSTTAAHEGTREKHPRRRKNINGHVIYDESVEAEEVDDASTELVEYLDAGSSEYATSPQYDKGWKITLGKINQLRELIFTSAQEADDFRRTLEDELSKEDERDHLHLDATLGDPTILRTDSVTFLFEIVSAWDIPAGDVSSSDPYVRCSFNGITVHQTKFISKTLDPIWTVKTGSLFLWTVSVKDLFLSDGLLCLVIDFDKIGAHEVLGLALIPPKTIFESKGERLEFKLNPPPGKGDEVTGYLAVRCRRASDYDQRFMKEYLTTERRDDQAASFTQLTKEALESAGGTGNLKSILTRNTRMVRSMQDPRGVKQYKVRPGPDPKRKDDTVWMTKSEIDTEYKNESQRWLDTGSGRVGRLFLEVLKCDDLPNLDTGGIVGNKTDAFVAIVFEDTVVTTDVIDDCLSPRWLPWSKRAFIFHIYHSSSQLFLGVFDYDVSLNPADEHDLVGRVSVDLSNLEKDTIYTLKYNIYTTARMSQRKHKGTITIRVRLEIDDERHLLLSSLEPPPQMYVNSKNKKDFRVVRYTCTGKYDMEAYSMKVINSYIEELLAVQHVLFYMQDAIVALLLWRGTSNVGIGSIAARVPVHSMTAFVTAIILVERPQLFPSFLLFGVAWALLATMDYRRRLPDVWSRCKSYGQLAKVLAIGESQVSPPTIEPYYNYDAAQEFLEAWKQRISDAEEAAARAYDESVKMQEEYANEMEELGVADTDLSTKSDGLSIDPFKPILFPVQQNLAMVCRYVRHLKYIVFWEECYLSFWLVSGCLILSVIFLFVPWLFLIRWSARVLAWTIFGPWMKLVDVFYVSKLVPLSTDEVEEKKRKERERRRQASSTAATELRIRRENASKLKAMKMYMFGKFITRVPVLKEDRYRDLPLPESMAVPYKPGRVPLSELAMKEAGYGRSRLPGQHLSGDMIPRIETHGFTEAPIGQATARPKLLDSSGPGGNIRPGTDTTVAAYSKLGSVVVSAAVLTWICVPVLAFLTEEFFRRWISR